MDVCPCTPPEGVSRTLGAFEGGGLVGLIDIVYEETPEGKVAWVKKVEAAEGHPTAFLALLRAAKATVKRDKADYLRGAVNTTDTRLMDVYDRMVEKGKASKPYAVQVYEVSLK